MTWNRKKKRKFIMLLFFLLLAVIILLVLVNREYLEGFVKLYIEQYGLIAILILSWLADSMDQPIGPEIPASIGVLFGLNIVLVIIFSTIGSYLASFINYYIGKGVFSGYIRKSYSKKKYDKYEKMFKKYGGPAVLAAALTPVPWTLFCWLAGSFKMKLRSFILWGLLPRTFRIAGIALAVFYGMRFFV